VSRSYGPGRYDRAYEERGLDYPIGYVRWTEARNMESILGLQASGRLDLRDVIDEVVPVEEAARAFERFTGPAAERPAGAILLAYRSELASARKAPILAPRAEPRPRAGPSRVAVTATRPARIRIGLIGPGSFASRVLVPAFVDAGARLELVGGGSGPSAEAAVRELGFSRAAPSADAVIADDQVDAVVVATRHAAHAELSIQALEAGKHVFCEKPLALTTDELDAVLAAAEGAGRILAVGFNRRFSPLLEEMRDFLAATTGPVASLYRVSAGQLDESHWTHDLDEGGGRVLGEVCHFIDSLRFLSRSDIELVHATAYGDRQRPIQARDNVSVQITFADDSIGTILYVAVGSPGLGKERLEAYANDRAAVLDDYRALELLGPKRRQKRRSRRQDKGHRAEIAAFVRAVGKGEPEVPLSEIANVSFATLAVVESMRTAQPIRIATEMMI
jgi:predicted dehydrogenase